MLSMNYKKFYMNTFNSLNIFILKLPIKGLDVFIFAILLLREKNDNKANFILKSTAEFEFRTNIKLGTFLMSLENA